MIEPSRERPKLLFFFSPTSGPSRRAESYLDEVVQHHGNHLTFQRISIDIEEAPELVELFKIKELPTILVLEGENVMVRIAGRTSVARIRDALQEWLL